MRLFVSILAIALLSGLAEYFFPWWIIGVVTAVITFSVELKPARTFLAGFLGIFFLWLSVSLWMDVPNHYILSGRMAVLFSLPRHELFLLVVAIVGGVAGGLSGWSGALLRRYLFLLEKE